MWLYWSEATSVNTPYILKMGDTYISLAHEGAGRYEEKKSVFLAFATPISSEEEAQAFITRIRAEYPDARHHVYAYILREGNKTRYSDDGEPSGTGGMPVLDIIRKGGITDAAVVVVRYYGGTLLGTGGLVRAYTASAKDAVFSATPIRYRMADLVRLRVSYPDYQKITSILQTVSVTDTAFGEVVTLTVRVESTRSSEVIAALCAQTSGRCDTEVIGKTFCGEML